MRVNHVASLAPAVLGLLLALLLSSSPTFAISDEHVPGLFDHLAKPRVGGTIGVRPVPLSDLPAGDPLKLEWERTAADDGGAWRVWVDERSGLPSLASGRAVAWVSKDVVRSSTDAETVDLLATLAADFLKEHRSLLGTWDGQIELDVAGSVRKGPDVWQIRFRQVIDGVPVEGAHYDFHVTQGNLVAFGARRWAPVRISAEPVLSQVEARDILNDYVRPTEEDGVVDLAAPELLLVPLDADPASASAWKGARGKGYAHRLIWRHRFTDLHEIATWTGEIDAHTGELLAFYDDTRYDRIKGHVNPISDDGNCPDGGCPEPGFPMPYVGYTIDGGTVQYTDQSGNYECGTIGSTIETSLVGPYVNIDDTCGIVSEFTTCDDELDLGVADGINCGVATGASPGNTDAARTAYYSLSMVSRKARFWTTGIPWLDQPVNCRTNVNATCNASWGANWINMYRAGNGCGNTGQIQGVTVHEWGHGFDYNDGGGASSSGEAYADVVALFESRQSCMGRGFHIGATCAGYGDTCLTCTGIREMDWDARASHTPATPTGFLTTYCGVGGGPCGKQVHCESHVATETIFDLATRDLPVMGIDADTAWQLAERLWYQSRPGTGGDIYDCTLPDSDSCNIGSWYHQLRVQDDDDGDLGNGTPHAAAIFAAFARHDIACGSAGDPENQNSSSCPTLAAPQVSFAAQTNAVDLSWDPVAGAAAYRVYRNELGCNKAQVPLAEVGSGTTHYLDEGLINDFTAYYRVQAVGANPTCESPVSNCLAATPRALAGKISFNRSSYGCSNEMILEVTDVNHPASSMTVSIWSDSETTPETVTLTETSVGSARFTGSIFTTTAPASADGLLTIGHGELIVAEYVDLDDGEGGINVPSQSTVVGDCVQPVISGTTEIDVSETGATIIWSTDKPTDTIVQYGEAAPPSLVRDDWRMVTEHGIVLDDLSACTIYYYSVRGTDAAGNLVEDDDGGAYHHFETFVDFGFGPQACHQGRISIETPAVACSSSVPIQVADSDLDTNSGVVDSVTVSVTSTLEPTPEIVLLTETGPNTARFTGSIPTSGGTPVVGDGILQVADGGLVTATYDDADDGTGNPGISTDTAEVYCAGPEFLSIAVEEIEAGRAVIRWSTATTTSGYVDWGASPALGEQASSGQMTTNHSVAVAPLDECGRVYFRIVAADDQGHTSTADAGGDPFAFNAAGFGGVSFRDEFDADNGWTLEGEWERAAPTGLGTYPADPTSAIVGTSVLGHDLTGLGAHPGDYEPSTVESATSPVIDASGLSSVELRFYRWLNVANGSVGYLEVKNASGTWQQVWASPNFGGHSDSSWVSQTFDVSSHAAGNSNFQIRFRQNSHIASSFDAGWNVDQLIVRDSTAPLYETCGGCGGAPSFAGIAAAVDDDPCGDSSVTLSWLSAVSWGTGGGGTYTVYRDTQPDFVPGPTNRLVTGLTATMWTDPAPPAGVTLHYVVQAENDETCSTGPTNGGLVDGNLLRVSVVNETGQAPPGDVGSTLALEGVNGADVRLNWRAAPGAAGYHVYRSAGPEVGFAQIGQPTDVLYDDSGVLVDSLTWYYLVVAADACGNESPD